MYKRYNVYFVFISLLLFSLSPSVSANSDSITYANANNELTQLINTNNHLSLVDKINNTSAYFLGRPYQLEPEGEGATGEFNQEPIYRVDRFDCQTYVSTVLAIVLSNNFSELQKNIALVNYKNGTVSFFTRNHFSDVDWLQNNIQNGFVHNISDDIVGNKSVATATAFVDRQSWYKKLPISRIKIIDLSPQQQVQKLADLHALSAKAQNVVANINYIPMDQLLDPNDNSTAIMNNIPSGTIIFLIHPNMDMTKEIGTHLNVTHMGFAIRKNNVLYFREASSLQKKVIDVPFVGYMRIYQRFNKPSGIAVISIMNRVA